MAFVNKLEIRVRFLEDPSGRPVKEWDLASGGDLELDIHEDDLDSDLKQLFEDAGARSAFLLRRTLSSGGRGATGLSVLQVLITVGTGVATRAAYDSLRALFEKFTNRAPESEKQRKARSKKPRSKRVTSQRRSARTRQR